MAADPDVNVKNGANLLDRLIKDIVTESEGFDIERFIPLLEERICVIEPHCRRFLIAWVMVLDSVPDIHLLRYLPKFLDGIFNMLKDPNKDIRLDTEACLGEFLLELKQSNSIDFANILPILIRHSKSKDELTRLTALRWILEFIELGKEQLLPFFSELLISILPCVSHDVQGF